jgi:hypothetical protein
MMPAPDVDARTIIETLNRHAVDYVVVGGFAVELWDVAVQPTVDVDITPERSRENMMRLAAALNELRAAIRTGEGQVEVPGGIAAELIEQMQVMNLSTSAGPLDLTVVPAGTSGYEDLIRNKTDLVYRGVTVPTASLRDVERSKESAGRPKDLLTLPAIRAHIDRMEELGRG